MTSKHDAEKYILYFDEIEETKPRISTETYRQQLIKRGTPPEEAANIILRVDPQKTGYISRSNLCKGINYDPVRSRALKDVKFLTCDMPAKQRDAVALLVLEICSKGKKLQEMLQTLKTRLENIYGGDWTCFIAEGRYWASNQHIPGTCLVFEYQGWIYGVHDTPSI